MAPRSPEPPPVPSRTITLARSLSVAAAGVMLSVTLLIYIVDVFHREPSRQSSSLPVEFWWPVPGYFLLAYVALMLYSRYVEHGPYALYDVLWGCNMSIILASIGMLTGRRPLVHAALFTVSGDQFCWYADVVGYIFSQTFPVGVAKYLLSPGYLSVSRWATASHHLWFIPLCMSTLVGCPPMRSADILLSVTLTGFLGVYCRCLTPFMVIVEEAGENNIEVKSNVQTRRFARSKTLLEASSICGSLAQKKSDEAWHPKPTDRQNIVYLNINLAFEFWRDIPTPFLHAFDSSAAIFYMPYLMLVGTVFVNGLPNLILIAVSHAL